MIAAILVAGCSGFDDDDDPLAGETTVDLQAELVEPVVVTSNDEIVLRIAADVVGPVQPATLGYAVRTATGPVTDGTLAQIADDGLVATYQTEEVTVGPFPSGPLELIIELDPGDRIPDEVDHDRDAVRRFAITVVDPVVAMARPPR